MVIKVLISGVTGYIGGSILEELLTEENAASYSITALVRKAEQVQILEKKGINCIVFGGLDDVEACRKAASQHDVVISAASAAHDASAQAWVRGLGDRRKETGQPVYYIHTTGESVIGYLPVLGGPIDSKVWSDTEDFHTYASEYPETVESRADRLPIFPLAMEEGVTTYVVVPTTVYGRGTGLFGTMSSQIPKLITTAITNGKTIVVGKGNGVWNHIHISDLAKLYAALLKSATTPPSSNNSAPPLPSQSIIWAENGTHTWKAASAGVAAALKSHGLLDSADVVETSLAQAAQLMGVAEKKVVAIWGSSAIGRSDLARNVLDWKPEHGEESWAGHFDDLVTEIAGK